MESQAEIYTCTAAGVRELIQNCTDLWLFVRFALVYFHATINFLGLSAVCI